MVRALMAACGCVSVGVAAQVEVPRSQNGEVPVRSFVRAPDQAPLVIGDPGGGGGRARVDFEFAGSNPEADGHAAAVFTPDGAQVIVANRDSDNLCVFDIATRALVRAIPLSGTPQSLALSADGSVAVTANHHEGTASIVDMATGTETDVIPTGSFPVTALMTSDGGTAVVYNAGAKTATVIDVASGAVLRDIPAGGGIFESLGVNFETFAIGFRAYGPVLAGRTLVMPDALNEDILLIDIDTGATTTLQCDSDPIGIAVTPDGSTAVVTHYFSVRRLSVIDLGAGVISKVIPIPTDVWGPVTIDPAGTKAVIAVQNNCRVVDLATDAVSGDLSTASVNELYTTFDGQYAVCIGFRGSIISYATRSIVRETNNFVSASVGAVSSVAHRAAMFSDTFGEDMVIVDTNGAAGGLLSAGPTGPAPEGDKCRTAALSSDGSTGVFVNMYSQNASIVDTTRAVTSWVDIGRRGADVAITPDESRAVITNLDSTFATIIDIASGTKTEVPISTRASEVEISSDGARAYVAVVVSDGVWRINLSNNTVDGPKLTTGNMGGVGYSYSQTSGLVLSHDDATLVTCNSFDNTISIIDTAAWAVVKTLAMGAGTFPTKAVFSPDDTRIYVANRDNDTVAVVSNAGAGSVIIGTINVGDAPYQMALADEGAKLYVINSSANTIGICDTAAFTQTGTIPLSAAIVGLALSPADGFLYADHSNASVTFGNGGYIFEQHGSVSVIDPATDTVVETLDTGRSASTLVMSVDGTMAAAPEPWGDGASIVTIEPPCVADLDDNGLLNIFDFLAFQTFFGEEDPRADLAPPFGVLNVFDFLAFQTAFGEGC